MSAAWTSNIPAMVSALRGGNEEGVREVVDDLRTLAQARAPRDTGALEMSAKGSVDGGGDVVTGVVSFDAPPYDEIQHRRTDFNHETGTHHYLSGPLEENRHRFEAHIAAAVRKNLG